jgi:amidase
MGGTRPVRNLRCSGAAAGEMGEGEEGRCTRCVGCLRPSWQRLIRLRQVTAVEVVQAYLARIEAVNPALDTVVQSDPGAGVGAGSGGRPSCGARALVGAVAWGALYGQRLAGDVRPGLYGRVSGAAGPCAGCGRHRCGPHAPGWRNSVGKDQRGASGNALYGRTHNPYNLTCSPAGSSSGEAAILAAGCPVGLGSDSGGSIRQPAHNCGIAGLKPTTGRVPLTGHYPRINVMNDPRTVIGPMARAVEDLALVLSIVPGDRLARCQCGAGAAGRVAAGEAGVAAGGLVHSLP